VTREGHGGEVVIPRGDTLIEPGDRVLLVTAVETEAAVRAVLNRVPSGGADGR
jgi:Trk K+ transport system NAD-binding subunit